MALLVSSSCSRVQAFPLITRVSPLINTLLPLSFSAREYCARLLRVSLASGLRSSVIRISLTLSLCFNRIISFFTIGEIRITLMGPSAFQPPFPSLNIPFTQKRFISGSRNFRISTTLDLAFP
uniref:Uncharacterized protein n=1 Tax=Cacopsylla melanoneura TaxID=428564 RepID=A0A8D9DPD4_9HEMI